MGATHNIAIRVAMEGTDEAKRKAKDFSDEADKAFKKVHDATEPASAGLKLVNAAGEELHEKFQELSGETGSLGSILTRLGPAGLIAAGAIGGIALAAHHAIEEAEKFEQQQRKLEAVLTATGYAAGQTKAQLTELAEGYAHTTLFTGEQVQQAEAILLTYKKIHSDVFDNALEATLNISTLFDNDLTAAARAVGRALEDPVNGLTALTRQGVALDPVQKKNIENLAQMGHQAEAQKIILDALAHSVGGQASAQNQGLTGATHQLSESMTELNRAFGENAQDSQLLEGFINRLTSAFKGLREQVRPTAEEEIKELNRSIQLMQGAGTNKLLFGLVDNPFYNDLLARRQKLEDQLAQVEKDKEIARDKEKEAIRKEHAETLLGIETDLNQKLKEATQTEQQKIIEETKKFKDKIRAELLPDGSNKADIDKELALADRLQNAKLSKLTQKDDDKAEETRAKAIEKINQELLRTKPSYDVAKQALDDWKAGLINDLGGATEENQKYIALIEQIYTVRLKEIYNKSLQDSNDWAAGAARGLSKYADDATNAAKNSERVFSNAAKGIEDTLVDMVSSGEFSLKKLGNLVQSIEQDILRSFLRENVTGPIAKGLSGLLGGGGSSGGSTGGIFGSFFDAIFHHQGGVVGETFAPHRMMPAWLFAGAPRLHSGLMPDEFPAILQRGETVLPKNMRAGGMHVTMNITTPNAQSFMESRGQVMAKFANEMQRYRIRNS